MNAPSHFNPSLPVRDQILFVLTKLHKASADEIAMEIMELQGVASEDGVADLTDETIRELEKMLEQGSVYKLREHRQKVRYSLESDASRTVS